MTRKIEQDEIGRIIDAGVDFFKTIEPQFLRIEEDSMIAAKAYPSSVMAMIYLSLIRKRFIEDLETFDGDVEKSVQFDLKQMAKCIKAFSTEIKEVEASKRVREK